MSEQSNTPINFEWMVVYTTYNMPEAHIVAGRLRHEDIPAFVNAAPRSVIDITLGTFGEITVVVHPDHYDAALSILEADEPELPENVDDIIIFDDDDDENEDD